MSMIDQIIDLNKTVETIKAHPLVAKDIVVRGLETGGFEEIK